MVLAAIFIMLLLMLVHVIAGAVSAMAGPSPHDFSHESPSANNVPGPTYAEDHLTRLQQEPCDFPDDKTMVKRYLSNKTVTCNDGSPAGFYIRPAKHSKKWIVFLEGGWYCYDQRSCHNRWMNLRHLMSSKLWPPTRSVGGILSADADENPFWSNAHHVLVPYCTSDTWSGTRSTSGPNSRFSFQGARVVRQVILDLLPLGLSNASTLLLAGSSAGGTGVLLNLNSVHSLLHEELGLTHVAVRGIADSGWFLDREPYSRDTHSLAPIDAVRRGVALWQGKVPPMCAASYPNEPWRCYFGYRIYPFLTAPLFVFQWLFDEAQMTADNVGAPVTKQQWDYIHKMGDSLRHSFENVSAVFAPSCISHSVLTKKDWQALKVNDITLPQALRCWDQSFSINQRSIQELYLLSPQNGSSPMLSDAPLETHPKRSKTVDLYKTVKEHHNGNRMAERQKRKKNHKRKKLHGRRRRKGLGRKNKNRPMRSPSIGRININSLIGGHSNNPSPNGCHWKLIDKCTWPQCNHKCPKLHNPFTGEEMDFIELLKSFGLDMGSVANALGIDIHTLNNMGHAELLNLLTQQNNR